MIAPHVCRVRNRWFGLRRASAFGTPNGHQALKNVTLSPFRPVEFVVVVGLSGAGKSTLIRCVNRLVTPTEGKLTVAGEESCRPE